MTISPPDFFDLYALAAGFVLAIGFVGWGAWRVFQEGVALQKKLEPFKRLPFAPVLELTEARVAIASRSLDRASSLMLRANLAIAAIGESRATVVTSVLEARNTLFAPLPDRNI